MLCRVAVVLWCAMAGSLNLAAGGEGADLAWLGPDRLDEKSDFGIVHPSDLPRPAAREAGPGLAAALKAPARAPVAEIAFDRAAHPRGFSQVWTRHRDEYLARVNEGAAVRLTTEATGLDSGRFKLRSVSGGPWRPGCPPQHINAEAAGIEVNGVFAEPARLRRIEVAGPGSVTVRARFLNSGEVGWRARGDAQVVVSARILHADGSVGSAGALAFTADVPRYRAEWAAPLELFRLPGESGATLALRCALNRNDAAAAIPFGEEWAAQVVWCAPLPELEFAGDEGTLRLGEQQVVERRPLAGGTAHVQGLAVAGGRAWVSSVDVERRVRDRWDRSAAHGGALPV